MKGTTMRTATTVGLLREIDMLRETNTQLREILDLEREDPDYGLKLPRVKRKLLSLLMRRGIARIEVMEAALPYAGDARGANLISVHLAQLRPLLPAGVEIKNVYGVGYYILEEHKKLLRERASAERGTQDPSRADGLSGHSAETGRVRVRDTESGEPAHQ
jgi:hypothetical protein